MHVHVRLTSVTHSSTKSTHSSTKFQVGAVIDGPSQKIEDCKYVSSIQSCSVCTHKYNLTVPGHGRLKGGPS